MGGGCSPGLPLLAGSDGSWEGCRHGLGLLCQLCQLLLCLGLLPRLRTQTRQQIRQRELPSPIPCNISLRAISGA